MYSARHNFATDLLDRTGKLKLVLDMPGHESVTTRQKYLHPSLKVLAVTVNQRNAVRQANWKLRNTYDVLCGDLTCKLLI